MIAGVVLEKTAYSFDKPYDYLVPEQLESRCKAGVRVTVPFGAGNSERQGVVLYVQNSPEAKNLKSVARVIDEEPILSDEMLKLCEWLHETLFCTYFDAVNAVLPVGVSIKVVDSFKAKSDVSALPKLSEEEKKVFEYLKTQADYILLSKILKNCELTCAVAVNSLFKKGLLEKMTDAVQKMRDATLKSVRIKVSAEILESYKLTEKQLGVAKTLADLKNVSVKELRYFTGVSTAVIDGLVKKGVAEYYEQTLYRIPRGVKPFGEQTPVNLTDEQQKAYEKYKELLSSGKSGLLYGITGSGKTRVFLKLTDTVIAEGKGVIIMVPEISLTPQAISIFSDRYGDKIAIFHSAMSLGERMDEWKRVKEGKALIAIGTRSAIFAPFKEIGLIIMDEEQEHTYKSEQSPRFHARDVARFRAAYHKAFFLMASATPSVETYCSAKIGKYTLCKLENRYGNAVLPETHIVDMRKELQSGNTGAVSSALYDEISEALNNKKQAIVLLNRRGHNTYVSCMSCGTPITCPNCSVSLTYHSANKSLMCHYCGYTRFIPKKCDVCESEHLKFSGIGTQKLEEELKLLFPQARVLRLDADSTLSKDSFYKYLSDFSAGEYDIMLGTQMVAKGLDFPNVTVVGVVGADKSLNSEDYKSAERTFSLLTQVIGRAGRGESAGVAVIQTTDPDNSIIPLAQSQDYDAFYNSEIMIRKGLTYPPYCDLVSVLVQSVSSSAALNTAKTVLENIKNAVSGEFSGVKLVVLGPSAAVVPKVNNKYRFRLLIKCKNNKELRNLLKQAVNFKYEKDTSVTVDMNPEAVM